MTNEERELFIPIIHSNIIKNIELLFDITANINVSILPENEAHRQSILEVNEHFQYQDVVLPQEIGESIIAFWADPAIKAAYKAGIVKYNVQETSAL